MRQEWSEFFDMSFGFGFALPHWQTLSGARVPWTPAALGSELALWLDANDATTVVLNAGNVSQWNDKSGNNRHVSQATASLQPAYDATGLLNKPTLRFNSPTAGRYMLSTASFPSMASGVSAMVVAQIDQVDNWNGYVGVGAFVSSTSNFEFYRQSNETVGGTNSGNLVTAANRDLGGGNVNFRFRNNFNTPPTQGTAHIATTVVSGATGLAGFMSINGGDNLPLTGGIEHPSGTFIPQGTGIVRVGVGYLDPNQTSSVMRGRISEIVMSASPWTIANRQLLEGYLAWKWGLVTSLPLNHPYRWDGRLFGGPLLWTPSQISTALWLDASDASTITLNGSTVSQWNDKSGNNRHVSQATTSSQPTYNATGLNSLPTLVFASSHALTGTVPQLANKQNIMFASVYFVPVRNNSVGLGSNRYLTTSIRWGLFGGASSTIDGMGWAGPDSNIWFGNGSLLPVASPMITTYQKSSSPSAVWNVGLNGTNISTVADTTFPKGTFNLVIGAEAVNPISYGLNGRMSEIVIADSDLSTIDRQKLEGYLAWKWNLQSNLPAAHPFRNSQPIV